MTDPSARNPKVGSLGRAARARYPELSGRVAVITGGAKGIGQGIATRLAGEGMRIVVADVDEAGLAAFAADLRAAGVEVVTFVGDVALPGDIDRLFETAVAGFGAVDLLVNNAADLERRRALDEHDDLLDLQIATNLRGPYLCSLRAASIMRRAGGGCIVSISSVGGIRAHQRGLPYDMTKGAVDAMTRAMAVDLGEYGIRVNAIGPGVTRTHRSSDAVGSARYRATADRIPLRRWGTPADIAAAVAFLASDEAGYITGQVIYVDGGIIAQLDPYEGRDARATDDDEKSRGGGRE